MSIVSALAMPALLLVIHFSPVALAAEADVADTKIEFKIKESLQLSEGVFYDQSGSVMLYNHEDYVPIKSQEEIKNEKILARWKEKQKQKIQDLPKEKFTILATAYTAAADECGKSDGITASGIKVKERRTLACPPQYPFGTKINIEGRGTLICEDRGGAIKGNHFDIYVETKHEAFQFGKRTLIAQVVE
jgi:3D (Asp-Asp-Asp) domain-containing protein